MEKRAAALADSGTQVIRQEDIFFRVRQGRLKLRFFGPRRGELIYYQRENRAGPKPSSYVCFPTSNPKELTEALGKGLGIVGAVRKVRHLYLVGNTRIHLDEVEGLGQFLELEVVLSARQTPREGRRIANSLMKKLQLKRSDLISGAYVDLLLRRDRKKARR
jgi:adenylate cyclase